MYEAFYGLAVKPFQLNPDPTFYFASKQHRRASAYLEYGVYQNEGFIVVTGEIGAGKTTIVRGLLASLEKSKVVAAQLVSTQLDADDTLRMVAAAFGVRFKDLAKADILLALEAFFVDVARKGMRCLLIVDEAQNLTPRAVEELRMLSNFQFESHALLQTFLVGQPEFRAILRSPQLQQLRQRVIAACHIGPLDQDETKGYIEHRLKCAGAKGEPSIDDSAYAAIYHASGGIPRRINALCDRLLLMGFLGSKKAFFQADVDEVAAEINDGAFGGPNPDGKGTLMAPPAMDAFFGKDQIGELSLGEADADEAMQMIKELSARRTSERMIRLERSLLRLERSNSLILQIMQKLVEAARVRSDEKGGKK
ncbi:MAG: XrtA-associated ATPase [Gammaproteobacteria bacterium]|nr:AAA family ATPase [Rhodocyclaceae bacterium]MBU3910125.1 XrtA-associated ATPase [Gammaproteobacteria bacterium]MBU3990064.1 XrtA-associated ATPase [Gammaproteobacteria bacterium]MBU4006132.1 XrtA-associated ATPase [Gammaproteobacteria bacterium]MBU4022587.1 XrtA-associated ATPase [Gammaproteobacteria bacterium]